MKTFSELKKLFEDNSKGTPPYYVDMRNNYKLQIYSGSQEANIYMCDNKEKVPVLKFMRQTSESLKVIKCVNGIVVYDDYKVFPIENKITDICNFVDDAELIEAIISL